MVVKASYPVATTVQRIKVKATYPVTTTVRASQVKASYPVATTIDVVRGVKASFPVTTTVRAPAVAASFPVATTTQPFLGTGVHRSLRRVTTPIRRGDGPEASPPPPPPDPPPVTTSRRLGHTFWTTPLPADAPVADTSADFVARLAYQAAMTKTSSPVSGAYNSPFQTTTTGANSRPFTTSFALPIYLITDNPPVVPVYSVTQKVGLQAVLDVGVPLPDPTLIPDGHIALSGTDGSVIVIHGSEVWELWQLRTRAAALAKSPSLVIPPGYDWVCTLGGKISNRNTHPGWWSTPPGWGVSASGISRLGVTLTAEDFYGDDIAHPIGLAIPITGGDQTTTPHEPSKVLPATRYDRMTFVPGGATHQPAAEHLRVPEGARFRLPADFDVDAWVAIHARSTADQHGTTGPILRKVLTAIKNYGLLLNDSSGVVTFHAENPKTFGTPYNPYTLAQAPVWGNFGQQIPWTSLIQVAPPTADISVPGA